MIIKKCDIKNLNYFEFQITKYFYGNCDTFLPIQIFTYMTKPKSSIITHYHKITCVCLKHVRRHSGLCLVVMFSISYPILTLSHIFYSPKKT